MIRKVNISIIVVDHIRSLRDAKTDRILGTDILLFYIIPALFGGCFFWFGGILSSDIVGSILGALSFFSGLLFSAQIALYSVRPNQLKRQDNSILEAKERVIFREKIKFFKDLNANISYTILLAALLLTLIVSFEVFALPSRIEDGVIVAGLLHFILTLLMLIKRMHVAFRTELYREDNIRS